MGLKPGEYKILAVLLEAQEGKTFTELKHDAALSAPVLSDYLKRLTSLGWIFKDSKTKEYKAPKIFKILQSRDAEVQAGLTEQTSLGEQDLLNALKIAFASVGYPKNKSEKERKNFLEWYFIQNLVSISWWLLDEIGVISKTVFPKHKKKSIEDVEKFYYRLVNSINDWLLPWICALGSVYTKNSDIANSVKQKVGQLLWAIHEEHPWVRDGEMKTKVRSE